MHTDSAPIARLAAKQEITEVLYRYCRGLDRMDRNARRHRLAPRRHRRLRPRLPGPADGFLDFVWPYHAQLAAHFAPGLQRADRTRRRGGNSGQRGLCVGVAAHAPADGLVTDLFHRGRYVDRWSRRAGIWAIDHRAYVGDLYREVAHSAEATVSPSGRRDETDPSYECSADTTQRFWRTGADRCVAGAFPGQVREIPRRSGAFSGRRTRRPMSAGAVHLSVRADLGGVVPTQRSPGMSCDASVVAAAPDATGEPVRSPAPSPP